MIEPRTCRCRRLISSSTIALSAGHTQRSNNSCQGPLCGSPSMLIALQTNIRKPAQHAARVRIDNVKVWTGAWQVLGHQG